MEQEILFKIIILGDTGVGKSCLLLRFSENSFSEKHNVTIGVEFGTKTLVINSKQVKLQIWDTAGQESFRSITRTFYRRASGVVLVYDTTARHTFENCKLWLDEIRQNSSPDVLVYLIGNQIDLINGGGENREVSFDEGKDFAKKNSLSGFRETSARSGAGIKEAFDELCVLLLNRWKDQQDCLDDVSPKIELKQNQKGKGRSKCC